MKTRNRLLVITILLTLFICISMIVQHIQSERDAEETLVYWGMYGDKVYEIQQKLKRWAYYDGPIDGYYGAGTFEAVRVSKEKRPGCRQVVGNQTAAAMGINLGTKLPGGGGETPPSRGGDRSGEKCTSWPRPFTSEARGTLFGEGGGSGCGLNRVADPRFPNTIEESYINQVLLQPYPTGR